MNNLLLCTFTVCAVFSFSLHTVDTLAPHLDFYWREFTRVIPQDAVPAGNYSNGTTLYIGQAVLFRGDKMQGIHPVSLHNDFKGVLNYRQYISASNRFIKILCSPKPQNFEWLRVTEETFHVSLVGEFAVEGGIEEGKRILNIARAYRDEEPYIGEVSGNDLTRAIMYGSFNGSYLHSTEFDVLVYRDNAPCSNCKSPE